MDGGFWFSVGKWLYTVFGSGGLPLVAFCVYMGWRDHIQRKECRDERLEWLIATRAFEEQRRKDNLEHLAEMSRFIDRTNGVLGRVVDVLTTLRVAFAGKGVKGV